MADVSIADWLPVLIAIVMWFGGFDYGVKRGEKRGRANSWETRPPTRYVELPCFGGPRDSETIRFAADCEQLRISVVERPSHPVTWETPPDGLPVLRQATYRRLWMGGQEQLVYQGVSDA